MKFSYNWLKDYIPSLPKPEKVVEVLTMHSFEVEGIEKKGGDFVFSIDILPNRIPDASGHRGVAKELGVLLKKEIRLPKFALKESAEAATLKVEVKDKAGCPRYTARVIKNVKVASSPKWLKARLEACGINSINNVVDAANYALLDTGQPLHAFDADKVEGKIVVRRAKKGENLTTLDGDSFKLEGDELLISDEKGPLALAGIKGGKRAEVLERTKNLILESANFEPEGIQKTSKKLGLLTDAAIRFRAGLSLNLAPRAIDELAVLIQKIAGGEVLKGKVDTGKDVKQALPKVRPEKVRKVLGIYISDKEINSILKRLDFSHRTDIIIEEDLIEEVARIYGYENVKPKAPVITLEHREEAELEKFKERLSERLAASGYSEIMSYSFLGKRELEFLKDRKNILELQNPTRPELSFLRPNLTLSIINALALNLRHLDEVRIFEFGKVFNIPLRKIKDTPDTEGERLGLGLGLKKTSETPFFELKGIVSSLLESLGLSDFFFEDTNHELFHPFRSAEIKVDNKAAGIIGEIHPEVREKSSIKYPVGAVEIYLEKLFEAVSKEREYEEISKFPAAKRDLAILVPSETRVEEVLDVIENVGGELLRDADLFDIYEGEEIPEGEKNLAFSLSFESKDKTLSDKEVDSLMQKIIKALESNPEWEVRK